MFAERHSSREQHTVLLLSIGTWHLAITGEVQALELELLFVKSVFRWKILCFPTGSS